MQLYIHLPFCKSKCKYCDFNSYAACDNATVFSYLNALNKEIVYASKRYCNAIIDTVYIGGGTPSLLDEKAIAHICKSIFDNFNTACKEVTIEANPESITVQKLETYRAVGIDRISIGIQSLDDNNLHRIGRLHNAQSAMEAVKLAGEYFDNVSADLIIGLPYDTAQIIKYEIATLAREVSHLSIYELTLEEGTPLARDAASGRVLLPDDDEVTDLFDVALSSVRAEGFERYEVSNFAKDGRISLHNFGYWTREEYLGIGAGAHSYVRTLDGKTQLENELRYASPKDIHAYMAGINCVSSYEDVPRTELCVLSDKDVKSEQLMLGLRTTQGVDKSLIDGKIPPQLMRFFKNNGDKIALIDGGMAVMNSILTEII